MPLTAATRLGPYEIVAPLGAGGMGEVYRARDARLGRDVAIKVLPSRLALDPTALARFERETRAVAALSHPNILAIFDIGREGDVLYAVTELLEGDPLRDRLRGGPLPLRKALEYGAQIAQGLAAAHDKGIVHRDLKPENIFLTPDGRAKVLDFGLAKPTGSQGDAANESTLVMATDPGMVAGTPPYMSPEQVRGQAVTPQSDLFSLGSVLFEMLTGRRAFQGQSAVETMTAVLREDPPDLTTIDPAIPPAVAALVRHCLEKQTAERFLSARDVAFHLQALAGAPTPSASRQPALPPPTASQAVPAPAAPRRRSRGRTVRLAVVGVIALTALLTAAWWLNRRPVASPHFTRVSYAPKVIYRAAFTPEKDVIVYSAAVDGNRPQLFQLGREYPTARPLGLPPDTHLLSISRTGEMALLTGARIVTSDVLVGTLARMPFGSAAPRPVLEAVRDADWNADGTELAVVRVAGPRDRLEYPAGHVLYETDGYLADVRVSPDGSRVAMFEHPMKWEARASLVVVDRSGRKTVLAGEYGFARGLAWRPDGTEIVFSASAHGDGDTDILAADLEGRTRVVLDVPGSLTVQDVSGAGQWLVTREERRVGIRALSRGEAGERELSWLDRSEAAALSADGTSLLFTELAPPAGAAGTVCLRPTDGSPVVALGAGVAQDLSPDGRWALAVIHTPPQLVLYPTGAGEKRTLPRGPIQAYHWASWFPDGRRVLACGTRQGGAPGCVVQDVDGGAPRTVAAEGDWGVVSPDGLRALMWQPEGVPAVHRLDGGGQPVLVPSTTAEDVPVRWTADGTGVFVYRPRQLPGQLDRVELASGRREMVRQFTPPDHVGLLSFDPVLTTADAAAYAYTYTRVVSTLFTVEHVK